MKKESVGITKAKNLSLRDVAIVVFRWKWLILLTFLTTAAVSLVLAMTMPDQYESRMKILVKNIRVETPVTPERTDAASNPNEISESQIISEIELLKSRDLLEKVVRNTNLAQAEADGAATEQDVERAVYKLEKDLLIAPVKKANIIEVNYTSKSPEVAALVLKQLSELYLDKHIKLHRPPGTSDFFKKQADKFQKDLRNSENELSSFQKKIDVVSINQQKELGVNKFTEIQSRLNDLNGLIKETDKRIVEIEKQLGGMEQRISTQKRVIPNQDSVERFNTMLVELRNRRTQLLAKFQPEDRLVKEVDEQIRTAAEALAKASQTTYSEQASDINPLRQSLEGELTRAKVDQIGRSALRDNLTKQVSLYKEQLAKLAGATTRHNDLERQVKQADESHQLYALKQEESSISDELDKQKISNVSIAELPTVPRVPFKTNRLLTALMGLGMGLLLGFGCAVTAEFFRESVYTPRELELLTGLPVLATIPVSSANERRMRFKSRPQSEDDFPIPDEIEDEVEDEDEDYVVEFINTRNQGVYSRNQRPLS